MGREYFAVVAVAWAVLQANAGAGRSMTLRPMMRMTEGGGDHTAGSSLSGAAPSNYANANFRSSNAESEDRAAAGSRLRKSVMSEGGRSSQAGSSHRVSSGGLAAGRRVSAVGGVHRRSALGAVMEAHAADNNAVDPHEQVRMHGRGEPGSGSSTECGSSNGWRRQECVAGSAFVGACSKSCSSAGTFCTLAQFICCSSFLTAVHIVHGPSLSVLQLPLDDVVLSHLTQLDLFVENLRQQLTNQAASVKAAKAEAAAVAAAVAAGHSPYSARRSRHVTPRSQYIQQQQQQLAAAQAEVGEDVGGQVGLHGVVWSVRLCCTVLCQAVLCLGPWAYKAPSLSWSDVCALRNDYGVVFLMLLLPPPLLVLLLVCLMLQASQQKSGGRNWQAARGLVMLNIQNWQKQRARSSHMQVTPMRAPTWEDVIMMVSGGAAGTSAAMLGLLLAAVNLLLVEMSQQCQFEGNIYCWRPNNSNVVLYCDATNHQHGWKLSAAHHKILMRLSCQQNRAAMLVLLPLHCCPLVLMLVYCCPADVLHCAVG